MFAFLFGMRCLEDLEPIDLMPGDKIHKWHLPSVVQGMDWDQISAYLLYIGPLEISML